MKDVENNKSFEKALDKSEEIVENKKRVDSILQKALKKLTKVKDRSKEFKSNIGIAISLVKDWLMGNYKEVPKKTIIYIIAALVYFIMPIDLIPDFIFKFGLLDDVAVLNFVLTSFMEDIENYKSFKKKLNNIDEKKDIKKAPK